MLWSSEDDRLLTATVAKLGEEASYSDVAKALTERTGITFTADSVRNRLKRIKEAEETQRITRPSTPEDRAFESLPLVPPEEYVGFRMAFFDIETEDLKAFMGGVLCWSIADNFGNITTRRITDFPQESPIDDRGVVVALREELKKYDIAVSWNGYNFDHSFINARLLYWGEEPLASIKAVDLMYKARPGRYGARIGSSRLDNVAKFFRTEVQKTPLDWDTWRLAARGDKAALDKVVEHCEHDVLVLRSIFHHLKPLVRVIHQ